MFGLTRKQKRAIKQLQSDIDILTAIVTASSYVTLGSIMEIRENMATQDDIKALADREDADLQAIASDLTQITDAITAASQAVADAIKAAKSGNTVDVAALENNQARLDAATVQLGSVASAITAIVPPQAGSGDDGAKETGVAETGTEQTGTADTGTTTDNG